MNDGAASRIRRKPSPALVVACIALLGSLTGTGIAGLSQVVPRKSVGPAQLKPGAVTSAKIRNGSVRLADLAVSARVPGPAGTMGPAGAVGPAGDRGQPGDDAGPSDAYSRSVSPSAPFQNLVTLATLPIGLPGSYVIWAKASISIPSTGAPAGVGCQLTAGSSIDVARTRNNEPFSLTLILVHTFSAPGNVNLQCNATRAASARFIRMTALRVDGIASG